MRPIIARTVRGAALRVVLAVFVGVTAVAPLRPLAAQDAAPGPVSIPLALQVGIPQGEFAQGVKIAGGIGGGLIFAVNSVIGLRTGQSILWPDRDGRERKLTIVKVLQNRKSPQPDSAA